MQLAVPPGEDLPLPAFQLVLRRNVPDGTVKPNRVVMGHVLADQATGFFQGQRHTRPNALVFDRAMPALQLAIALRVVRRGPHMRHPADPNELLEVLGDELRAVVGDDPRVDVGERFPRPLDDDLHVGLGHRLADLPVHHVPAATVQKAA